MRETPYRIGAAMHGCKSLEAPAFRHGEPSHFPLAKPVLDAVIAHHWAIFAEEGGAELTVPTQANGTLHVPFHGDKDVVFGHATLPQGHHSKTHHDLRATEHGHGLRRIERRPGDELGHDSHAPSPWTRRPIHGDQRR